MNVLYLLNHAGKAGTERYVQTLVEKLDRKKINAFFAYNEDGLLRETLEAKQVKTFRLLMKHPFDIVAAYKLSRICRENHIDLIHTHYLRENYIAILSRLFNPKIKVVYTNHFVMRNNTLVKLCNRIMTRFQFRIIAVCNKGKEVLIDNGNKGSIIKVIFNGVDPEYWKKSEPSTLRQELSISDQDFIILCASRFAHDKGHAYLVKTIHALKSLTNMSFKCVLAGDGPLLEETQKQVKALNLESDILFTGFRADIKNLFNGSDLYFNASEHEALSFLIIEALASGLPVIATDMGGNRDIVNDETRCGVLVEYNNAESSAVQIQKVMEDKELLGNLKKNAFMAIENRFNINKIALDTYEVYTSKG